MRCSSHCASQRCCLMAKSNSSFLFVHVRWACHYIADVYISPFEATSSVQFGGRGYTGREPPIFSMITDETGLLYRCTRYERLLLISSMQQWHHHEACRFSQIMTAHCPKCVPMWLCYLRSYMRLCLRVSVCMWLYMCACVCDISGYQIKRKGG